MSLKHIMGEHLIWGIIVILPWIIWLSVFLLLALVCVLIWYFAGACDISKIYMKLAANAFTNAKYTRAAKYCEAALEYDESLSDAYQMLAHIAMQVKDYDGAMEILKRGLEKMKEAGASTDGLNEVLGEINLVKVVDSLNVEE